VGGQERVFVASGEILYALDARTGVEVWRFTAGTGCRNASGQPPGLCAHDGERNEIESSVVVADGKVFFGLDTNDVATGKGGVFAVSAADGRLAWFFDLESGETCRPLATDAIRRYDGYHSAAQLGLPADFFATRPGCGADRTPTGCGNVWSSAAYDPGRGLLYFTSSNCDTDDDPTTGEPPPPMPPYDEAVFALKLDGTPAWRWRPREVDNADLAFGAAPNLFSVQAGGAARDVLGVGNKDGTYTVLDRDGVNEVNGVAWNDPGASAALPYWSRKVVPGGSIGGVPQTAAVDEAARRVLFSTAPGNGFDALFTPQTPTLHALDLDTGTIVWDSSTATLFQPEYASYGPTSAIPGVVFFGTVPPTLLRVHDSANGTELASIQTSPVYVGGIASGAVVIDGTVLVGGGIGSRGPGGQGDAASRVPFDLVALCVPGTTGCAACNDGLDDDGDGKIDFPADPGCTSAADVSERAECEDGIDNDHDGKTDWPADAGCRNRLPRATESPACSNGVDDDGDGKIDFPADPSCTATWGESEAAPPPVASCGLLGIEAAAALLAVRALRGRSRVRRAPRAAAGACLAVALVARSAAAEPVPVAVTAHMTVYLGDQAVYTGAPVAGSVLVDVDGGTLDLAAGLVAVEDLVVPIAPGAFGPVTRLTLDARNSAGRFAFGGGAPGACPGPLGGAGACVQGGGFGGLMALSGALRVSPLATTIPLGIVGAGGVAGSQVVLQGAPWTARTAAVTTTGPAHAWYTRMGQGSGAPAPTLVLVTPIHVSSTLTSERLPFFLELTLAVPEPGTGLLLAAGVAGIATWRRRRAATSRATAGPWRGR
jgi:outer membrane protein assembly factor BamB